MRHLKYLSLAAFAIANIAVGQTVSTQILGSVTDPAGAVIPGAEVTATRVATRDVRKTTANDTGNYIFPLLEIGDYEITCSAAGFKTQLRRGIVLQLQDKLRLDFRLEIGQQMETVTVEGGVPLLRTEDATLGSVIEHKRVVDLPLNGRNFAQAATLMPGVVYGASRMGADGQGTIAANVSMPGQIVGISANGQRDANQNITVDGVVAVDPQHSAMLFVPSIEAIEEFKIQSAVYSAEYGMNSGAQANVALKSGANQLHATVFEFLRNDKLDARGFFLAPGSPKNKLRRNQFGGVASGPVIKNKTFWLFSYEGRQERRSTPSQASVPTLAMRAGDFSELLIPRNRWYPGDTTPASSRAIRLPGSAAPFPNNIIPASLIAPISLNLLTSKPHSPFANGGFLAPPNADNPTGSTINLTGTGDQILNNNQYLARIDHRFGDRDRLFGHYIIVDSLFDDTPLQRTGRTISTYLAQNLGIGYTKILSPTLLNEMRFGINRMHVDQGDPVTNTDFTQRDLGLDFRVVGADNRQLTKLEEGLPTITMAGFSSISSGTVQVNTKTVYEFTDNLTMNRGRHNLKFGGLYRYNTVDIGTANLPRGQMNFTRDIVGLPDAFAAFMLGYPLNSSSAEGLPFSDVRQNKLGFYVLDDLKATSRLTINLGLRWDYMGPVTDALGHIRNLSFANGQAHKIGGQVVPMLVPDPSVQKNLNDVNGKQFMPRLGIAWRITDRTVLRTGAGNFYSTPQTGNFTNLSRVPPFSGSVVFQNDTTRPTATIDKPFAGAAVAGTPQALVMLGNLSADGFPYYRASNIWQWSLELEQSLSKSLVAGFAYVGSAASHIDNNFPNFNNPDPGAGAVQGRRPYQNYVDSRQPNVLLPLGTVRLEDTATSSNYNSLQARVEKRYSHGLSFVGSFNYQKAMFIGYGVNENAGFNSSVPQNPRNRLGDYGRSNIDQRFRFVFSHIWEIPWMRQTRGLKGALLGGWTINGIVQMTSGLPVTIGQSGDAQNTGPGSTPRPNVVAGQPVTRVMDGRTIGRWFNTAAFVQSKYEGSTAPGLFLPGTLGYGNAGVGLFDAPGQKTWDFALFKEFKPRETHRIQFRWEAFNFLNTPQFSGPSRLLGSADFGRINATLLNNREMQFGLKYIF